MKKQAIFLIILVIALALFFSDTLTIYPAISFAGFTWQQNIQNSGSIGIVNEVVVLTTSWSGQPSSSIAELSTDVSGIDELLVIGEADCYATAYRSSAGSGIQILIRGSEGGAISLTDVVSASSSGSEPGQTKSEHIDARIFKFRNNFDGTWSALESLGIGDVFIVRNTQVITGSPLLVLASISSGSAPTSDSSSGTSGTVRIYNVVVKENAFAVCKADEFWQDKNQDGKPTSDECFNLQTIVLNSEEAIKESLDEKIARITAELEAKNAGISAELEALKQQTQTVELQLQVDALKQELAETNRILADVIARDANVIATVEAEEKFEEPNIITTFFNRISAFIMAVIGFIAIPFLPP